MMYIEDTCSALWSRLVSCDINGTVNQELRLKKVGIEYYFL
jgi:hypothetical protein